MPVRLQPTFRIPIPLKFEPSFAMSDTVTFTPTCNTVAFVLIAIDGVQGFYECQCGAGSIASFDMRNGVIPDEIIDEMQVHVELNHVK
jgi:hypothetical protein